MGWAADTETNRLALAILLGFFIARLVFAFSLGLGVDESYTLAISRRLSLSYFDHPPLHQWVAHFVAQQGRNGTGLVQGDLVEP